MKLTTAINLYRKYRTVNRAVRMTVAVHHALRPASRTFCTLEDCSGTGLAEATQLGWRALPGILARMNACGSSVQSGCFSASIDESTHCRPASGLPFCEDDIGTRMPHFCDITAPGHCWKLGAGVDRYEWCIGTSMPHPSAPGFKCDD